jgi:hypothetical protein
VALDAGDGRTNQRPARESLGALGAFRTDAKVRMADATGGDSAA